MKAHSVTIIGQPSAALADKIEKEVTDRVAETVARLGPEGLAALAQRVEDAQKENDKPIPPEMIRQFSVPDVTKIDWIHVESGRSEGVAKKAAQGTVAGKVQKYIDADATELPLFIQYDRERVFVRLSLPLGPS